MNHDLKIIAAGIAAAVIVALLIRLGGRLLK